MKTQSAYGFIHCHSEHSIKDSALKIENLVKRAKDMGAAAVSLTDHGTCTGIIQFVEACKAADIKPIVGVEAYMHNSHGKRTHLLLLAKNYAGYQEISKAVTESNKYLDVVSYGQKKIYYPVMNKNILMDCFGNGNVIATSACISGVLSSILLENDEIDRKICKLKEKQQNYSSPQDKKYIEARKKIDEADQYIQKLMKRKKILDELAGKSYKQRKKRLKSLMHEDYSLYCEKLKELESEMKESEDAALELISVKEDLKSARRARSSINTLIKKMENRHNWYNSIQEEIDLLTESIMSEKEAYEKCREELLWYSKLFGKDFLIELQYHGMEQEAYVMPLLTRLAIEYNIPVVAANDVHMANKEDVETRQLIRSLRFNKWEDISVADNELYMKSDEELRDALLKILPETVVDSAMKNIRIVCDICNFEIPALKHYPKYIDENSTIVENADTVLREKTINGIDIRYNKNEFTSIYQKRMKYELDIIISMGFADYLLIVADFINYAKRIAIENNEYEVGYGVGPGRGSAVGSLVCFLLGITNVDPVQYNLKFERFLNENRITMPDIDTDFSAEIRMDVIEYVKKKYGTKSVAFIRTESTQAAKASIHNTARLLGDKEMHNSKYYSDIGNKIAKAIPSGQNMTLNECSTDLISRFTSDSEKKIIKYAATVEKNMTGLGIHPGGIIIGDGKPLSDYVPLLYNKDMEQWAVQCDKEEAENIGLLKIDFLGLRNLDVLSECIRRIKKYKGITVNLDTIPFETEIFKEIFSQGKTKSVFQFESSGMRETLKRFKPESFDDIILLIAAYRPGPMEFISGIIDVKNGKRQPYYCIPELEDILAPTYGYPIYQEQLMDIFSECAGFTQSEADIIRRYMSKKKTDKFMESKPQFMHGIISHGASEQDAEILWKSLVNFSKYAFNKSHATAYAIISYQTAYLKYHYSEYYMCSVLNQAKPDKIGKLLYECKEIGIKIVLPDINASFENFENNADGIIYGLGKIKTVKSQAGQIVNERERNGHFKSFKDFVLRTQCNKSVIEALIKAGAMDKTGERSRKALLENIDTISSLVKTIRNREEKLYSLRKKVESSDKLQSSDKIKIALHNLQSAWTSLQDFCINQYLSDGADILKGEYEVLGYYISAHPLDPYINVYKDPQITLIEDFQIKNAIYVGMIKNLRQVNRKSDGAPMAFFEIEDLSGTIQVNCFTKAFKEYKEYIEEGRVVKMLANGMIENGLKEDESINKLVVQKMENCILRK